MTESGDYISREAAIQALCGDCLASGNCGHTCKEVAVLQSIPAADARPVRRGKWERMSDNDVFGDINCKCSACGEDWWQGPGWFRHANFCPNCGARMEES